MKGRYQMKLSFILPVILIVLFAQPLLPQAAMPRMTSVEPANGKVGDVITVIGENLEKKNVSDVFLTDSSIDLKVVVTEQTPTAIKFKIPPKATAGRWALMVLTPGKEPKLIEQPVKLTVDE
ncbi:MAG: IPT/TIG domain-containing protein [Acidobacteria bacterium]|nr:IPT/TIG domain-containing protein [Acidobacteriota bacterium]